MDLCAYLICQHPGFAREANQHRIALHRWIGANVLGERAIQHRPKILTQSAGLRIVHDADDFVDAITISDTSANRIFLAEKSLDEELVDDRRSWRCSFSLELAPSQTRNAHRGEVPRTGHVEINNSVARLSGLAFDLKTVAAVATI